MNSKSRRDVIRYGRILKCALLVVLFAFLAIVYSRENAKDVSMDKIEAQLIKKTNIEKLAEAEENWQAEHPLEKGSVYVERV